MNIPQSIHPFSQKTCLVVADHTRARFFLLDGQNAQELPSISSEYPPKENMERTSMVTPSGTHSAEEAEHTKDLSWKSLVATVNQQLTKLLTEDDCKEIVLFLPEDAIHSVQEELDNQVFTKVVHLFPKILINHSLPEILEHLSNELKKI